ncbi:MAG TPA: response regulator [Acidobacteriota bacterium]|nr:response regulator [Acidobacteriota bacterium]
MRRKVTNILLIDDDPDDLYLVESVLRRTGSTGRITTFCDETSAMSFLKGESVYSDREKYPLPHIILTDVHLSFGGSVLTYAQHAPTVGIPITVFSGSQDFDDVRKAYLMGASSYIVKDTQAYRRKVGLFFEYWKACEHVDGEDFMFVDDSEDDAFFLERSLRKFGARGNFTLRTSGQSAEEYLLGKGIYCNREKYPLPSHVITDLKMACGSGLDLLSAMNRRSGLGLPVVVISGSSDPKDVEKAYQLGASSYMSKGNLEEKMKVFNAFWNMCELPQTDSCGKHLPTSSHGKIGEFF